MEKVKQKIPFIPLSDWMGGLDANLLQSYKKIFFAKYVFVLALNERFVTPERLYFSTGFSENESALFF